MDRPYILVFNHDRGESSAAPVESGRLALLAIGEHRTGGRNIRRLRIVSKNGSASLSASAWTWTPPSDRLSSYHSRRPNLNSHHLNVPATKA